MKLSKRDYQLLQNLADIGVEFSVFGTRTYGGFHTLPLDKLEEYVKDPELWRDKTGAKQEGVSLQQYRAYVNFLNEPQCRGVTAKGKRCKRIIVNIPRAADFNEDIDCYCSHHSRLG